MTDAVSTAGYVIESNGLIPDVQKRKKRPLWRPLLHEVASCEGEAKSRYFFFAAFFFFFVAFLAAFFLAIVVLLTETRGITPWLPGSMRRWPLPRILSDSPTVTSRVLTIPNGASCCVRC